MEIPTKQQKVVQVAKGLPADVLRIVDAPVERPAPGSGDILVQVRAVAFNHLWKLMPVIPAFLRKLPAVPEIELAGVIADPGESAFATGDEVFGFILTNMLSSDRGALAQYVLMKAIHVVHKPAALSWEAASGLTCSGLTAARALSLFDTRPKKGLRILVAGASSALGRAAIQIAKGQGAYVVASCSAASAEGVRALGADEILDYTASPLPQQLATAYPYDKSRPSESPLALDLIIDCIGADPKLYTQSPAYLAKDGVFVQPGIDTSGGALKTGWHLAHAKWYPGCWAGGVPRTFRFLSVQVADDESLERELAELAGWTQDGTLRMEIDSVHAFDRAGVMTAYERVMSGKARGKVVVRVS
ncbi:NAD(P)-binding protein [Athelia psychrophila]|uniref:NAD(P)-binding protein n=1 Tax=Athelia psychrophila TaxID=1759441 RepID=A0A166JFL3_9AGAM|nr:NAD(P)-binding protein [Fibularhizoctonia sp. CBS 109695]